MIRQDEVFVLLIILVETSAEPNDPDQAHDEKHDED